MHKHTVLAWQINFILAVVSEGYTQYVITCNVIQALHPKHAPKKYHPYST